jgi:hypothetical protein
MNSKNQLKLFPCTEITLLIYWSNNTFNHTITRLSCLKYLKAKAIVFHNFNFIALPIEKWSGILFRLLMLCSSFIIFNWKSWLKRERSEWSKVWEKEENVSARPLRSPSRFRLIFGKKAVGQQKSLPLRRKEKNLKSFFVVDKKS